MRARIRGLRLLDASPLVDDPAHWADLYRQALVYREQFGGHVIFVAAGDPMRVIFDTAAPFASPPPDWAGSETPAVAALAASMGKPVVGNLCACRRPQSDSVALAVPVTRGGRVAYVLTAVFETVYFDRLLKRMSVPDGWHLGVIDGQGATVTFTDGAVTFTPPPLPPSAATPLPQAIAIAAGEERGALHTPQVIGGGMNGKHLSYIDICVSSSKGRGGKKGPK